MSRAKGFTLIELLVVVSIIALLVAILLPALSEARELAAQAVCLHNTKQWALALVLYEHDYGCLPSYCHAQNTSAGGVRSQLHYVLGPYLGYNFEDVWDIDTWWWFDQPISRNGESPDIWYCPAGPDLAYGYGFNIPNVIGFLPFTPFIPGHSHVQMRQGFSLDEIPRPASTLAMTDSSLPLLNYTGGSIHPPYGPEPWTPDWDYDGDGTLDSNRWVYDYYAPGGEWDVYYGQPPFESPYNGIAPRHPNRRANCAFLDGHAEPMFISDLMDENRRLWGEDIWE